MIRLLAVGQCGIELDGKRLSTESEIVFGLLLYLAARAGDTVSREEAQALFWPELSHTRGRHCLRQAAYRLRQLGVPLRSDNGALSVALGDVTSDFAALIADDVPAAAYRDVAVGDVLPGYQPLFSPEFTAWVEDYRARIALRVRQALVRTIVDLRSKGRYREAEPLARVCLTADPFNEVATLTLAEATAVLSGNRAEAMAILDRYIDEIGGSSEKRLTLSASVLRRRISERFVEQRYAAPPEPPFVGREDVLQLMVEKMQEAVAGRSTIVYLWGEPGIGKTRLLDELAKVADVQGVRLERYAASPNDPDRPLALFSTVLPRLMQMPGAAGISPEAFEAIQRFVDPSAWEQLEPPRNATEAGRLFGNLKAGICELLEALADERSLGLFVDDTHWMDPRSLEVFAEIVERVRGRRVAVVFTSRESAGEDARGPLNALCARATVRRLEGLGADEVESLLKQIAEQRHFSLTPAFVRRTLDTCAGNPLFVSELATHYGWNGVRDDLPHNMQTLLQKRLDALPAGSLLVFQACAISREHATVDRVARMLGTSLGGLAEQLQELESAGFIMASGTGIVCRHQLLEREAQRRLTPSIATALHGAMANVLRKELETSLDLGLAHACLSHLVDAHQQSSGVFLAIQIGKRLLDNGATEDARQLIKAALALGATSHGHAEVLALRIRASRAAGDWEDLSVALAEFEKLSIHVEGMDEGELRRIAFEARTYSGELSGRDVAPQIALLSSGDLALSERKRVAMNALIACCDAFDSTSARVVFSSSFRASRSALATLDDLIGNLLFHTSFGSLDTAVDVANRLAARSAQAKKYGHRETQLLRWCARPFHLIGEESEACALLAESREVAQTRGLFGEIHASIENETFFALELEDAPRAAGWIERILAYSLAPSPYADASVHLLQLHLAVLNADSDLAHRSLAVLEQHRLPDCNRVRFVLSACRVRIAALRSELGSEDDLTRILTASEEALSALEMDWVVSAACAYAVTTGHHLSRTSRLLERYMPLRRARFRPPQPIAAFVSAAT